MRCIFETLHNSYGVSAKVRGKNQYGEYVVRMYANRMLLLSDLDYFTNDRDDAIATALEMVRTFN